MQREFEVIRNDFMRALQTGNANDIVVHATDLLHQDGKLPWVWANRGMGLHQMGHHIDAILNYEKALQYEDTAIAHNNMGTVYFDLERPDEAMACYTKSLAIEELAQTHMNIGHVKKWQGHLADAIVSYRKAIAVDPDYADAQLALSMALLKTGDLQEGGKRWEWRWKTNQLVPRGIKKPQWSGQDLTHKTILVYGEQGLGDIIQFARYVRILSEHFPKAKIIIEGRQPVKRLLETIPEAYAVINFGDRVPDVDYVIPMMTLAWLLTPTVSSIPVCTPEYYIQSEDVNRWAEKLLPLTERFPNGLKVGLCWAGMSRTSQPMAQRIDGLRSTTLDTFAPLAKIPNIAWISLQKGPPASQVQKPPVGMTIGDFTEDMYDFYETCAAISNCDLVISVDTAVVHAAASLGKPTWLADRWDGCWRWFDRADSPWYPSLRKFSQASTHDWASVVNEMGTELTKLAGNKNALQLDLTLAK